MTKGVGSTHPLPVNPDLWKAVETFYEFSMVTWHRGWHLTLLSKYLYSKCCQDAVLEAVIGKLHDAIQKCYQTSAHGGSVATVAQCLSAVNTSAFRDLRDLRSSLLTTHFVCSSL